MFLLTERTERPVVVTTWGFHRDSRRVLREVLFT